MKHETFIGRWIIKKNPALCDDVIEQRDQAISGRTISTFKNTFGNI